MSIRLSPGHLKMYPWHIHPEDDSRMHWGARTHGRTKLSGHQRLLSRESYPSSFRLSATANASRNGLLSFLRVVLEILARDIRCYFFFSDHLSVSHCTIYLTRQRHYYAWVVTSTRGVCSSFAPTTTPSGLLPFLQLACTYATLTILPTEDRPDRCSPTRRK